MLCTLLLLLLLLLSQHLSPAVALQRVVYLLQVTGHCLQLKFFADCSWHSQGQ
jgi:hypothetical protein